MIYYEVQGGLCNRMRALASAYKFSKDVGQQLTIIWHCNSECKCRFDRLFMLNVQERIDFIWFWESFYFRWVNKMNRHRMNKIKASCDIVYEADPCRLDKEQMKKEAAGKNVYIHSYTYWYKMEDPFSIFTLRESLQNRIKYIKGKWEGHVCGVHIRRTDHAICKEKSPTVAFVEKMQIEVEKNPSVKFYVASDDTNEKEYLRTVFGAERIITNENAVLKRNMARGIADAVIDLYALSETEKIFGSVGSSFSEVASQIKGTPLICCGRE